MREAEPIRSSGRFVHQSRAPRLVDRVEQVIPQQVFQRFEHGHIEFTSDDGREREHPVALGRQSREPAPDDFFDAFGQSQLAEVGARALAHLREDAGLGQVPERLRDKEGVAVGTLGDVRRQLARGVARTCSSPECSWRLFLRVREQPPTIPGSNAYGRRT